MYKSFLSLILLLGAWLFQPKLSPRNQNPFEHNTVCHSYSDDMAQFANALGFASFHPSPIQIDFDGQGEMINFPTVDGNAA